MRPASFREPQTRREDVHGSTREREALDRRAALKGHGAMLLFSWVVSGSFIAAGLIANDIAPAVANALRFGCAALLLMLLAMGAAVSGGRGPRLADFAAPWRYAALGALFAFYFVCMFEGLKTAPPFAIGAVFTLTPAMTALFAWPLLGQKVRGDLASALALGALGAVWIIFRGDLERLLALDLGRGELIYLFGCALHALFTPLMRRWNRGEPPLVSTALVMGAGFFVLLAYGWADFWATDFAALPARVWWTLAYLIVFASALSLVLLQYANQRLPSSKVMAYSYLTPAWVLLLELAFGSGQWSLTLVPGFALLLLTQGLLLREDR